MSYLPIIVGFGGINSAGRTSFHHGFQRFVIDSLNSQKQVETYTGLATQMGLLHAEKGQLLDTTDHECSPQEILHRFSRHIQKNTLLRRIGEGLFDPDQAPFNTRIQLLPSEGKATSFHMSKRQLPNQIPATWEICDLPDTPDQVKITLHDSQEIYLPDRRKMQAQAGGQLPTGFDPANLYPSKNHPRGLQMAVFAATDAVRSIGIEWDEVKTYISPDQIGVYASSAMGQLDHTGTGGMMTAAAFGKRTSSKQLAMGLAQMPSDFINAYLLGNLGHTSAQIGACATLLYNLNAAVSDIRSGKRKVAIVGASEAPLLPEIYEGYRAMSALGEDSQILKLDGRLPDEVPNYRHACRPFSNNCGFALGESAQYFVLFADDLAIETGAQIHGAVGDVFINADGYKKSISAPGFGNYISLAKALGFTRTIVGEKNLHHTFISAHGTGTPHNRTTESHGLNEIAKAFHIHDWPVSAIKCYVGHTLGAASGDQLAAILGTWESGLIPGIATLDKVADDVHQSHLRFSREHIEVDLQQQAAAFINAKGFGGNNATGVILSPRITRAMLTQKHGTKRMQTYTHLHTAVEEKAEQYNQQAIVGEFAPIYKFGTDVLDGEDLNLTDQCLTIPGYGKAIDLDLPSPYPDMTITEP